LLLPLTVYLVLVSGAAVCLRDQINPDAVCYLRNARYLAEGRWADAVSAYWSPGLSWCLAPLLYFGLDGLYAARVVLAVWGGLFLIACFFLLRSFTEGTALVRSAALGLIALCTVYWAAYGIGPDLLLSACLLAYCSAVVRPDLLQQRGVPLLCGALGGAAYLAKAYGLPFFLAHFTFTVGLRWALQRPVVRPRQAALAWGLGILAFAVVSGPWLVSLSHKYGRPTFASSAAINHALIGPPDRPRDHPLGQLSPPPPGRLCVWEVPESLTYNFWSPLESASYLRHQVKYTVGTAKKIAGEVAGADLFHLTLPALVLFPVLGLGTRPFRAWWMLGTLGIYAAGFTLVYYEERYTVSFFWPLLCIYGLCSCTEPVCRSLVGLGLPRSRVLAGALVVLLSFAVFPAEQARQCLMQCLAPTGVALDGRRREIAHELRAGAWRGPVAASTNYWHSGLHIAYHLDEPFLGVPAEKTVPAVEAALHKHGARLFLVSAGWELAEAFRTQTSWELKHTTSDGVGRLYAYVPPAPASEGPLLTGDSADPARRPLTEREPGS
jgi:hypothetical protein